MTTSYPFTPTWTTYLANPTYIPSYSTPTYYYTTTTTTTSTPSPSVPLWWLIPVVIFTFIGICIVNCVCIRQRSALRTINRNRAMMGLDPLRSLPVEETRSRSRFGHGSRPRGRSTGNGNGKGVYTAIGDVVLRPGEGEMERDASWRRSTGGRESEIEMPPPAYQRVDGGMRYDAGV